MTIDARDTLADFTFVSKYARYRPDLKRRETFEEATHRMMDMHRSFYAGKGLDSAIDFCEKAVLERRILGSQRALQFGGDPILRKNMRVNNCSASFADRPRFFAEALWLLLCGCGVGFSVQKHHVAKLPLIVGPTRASETYVVEDSIEGWANALDILMASYFEGLNTIRFDYSQVRPEGAPLSSASGKAPGPKPLRDALEAIRKLLDARRAESIALRPIDVYDIVMLASGAVLAGGVRRSATIAIFSPDDEEMLNAKTGDWFKTHPWRSRSNNSALLVRGATSRETFDRLMTATKEFGEPGFYWADSTEVCPNPCQPAFATVLTPEGIRQFKDIDVGSTIWSEQGWTRVVKKWSTGTKPVYRYRTVAGEFVGTDNHRVVQAGEKVEVGIAEAIDHLRGPQTAFDMLSKRDVLDGLLIGDGSVHKAGGGVFLVVGQDDRDEYEREFGDLIHQKQYGGDPTLWRVPTSIEADELPKTYERRVPDRFKYADPAGVAGFLRGLFSANGSVVGGARVTLKTASKQIRDDVQVMLSSLGIASYFTTNQEHDVEFENGTYTCRESYDVNISADRHKFMMAIGFVHEHKTKRLLESLERLGKPKKSTYEIVSREALGEHEVFDITVDNDTHTYWTGGVNVSNCGEIAFHPVDDDGVSGWGFCNLATVNVAVCKTEQDFYSACDAAATLATLQAGYQDVGYLTQATKNILLRDAQIGVSLTGMADNPDLAFDPEVLIAGADIVKQVNEHWAKKIGVAPAVRCTTVKPEGTGSLVLKAGNGIHPHHAQRYIRHVQMGANEAPARFIAKLIPEAVEPSQWRAGDVVVAFPIDLGTEHRWLKKNTDALDHLCLVRDVQRNWVEPGTRYGRLHNNVSNTVQVRDDQWSAVADCIFISQHSFAGVSLLGETGDLDYVQAPFVAVDGPGRDEVRAKYDRLVAAWREVAFSQMSEDEDGTTLMDNVACAGGACQF